MCRKGYISTGDLQEVFELLGESISDEEVNTMIKIAGIKSSDKINFKEFVDFFYKIDWYNSSQEYMYKSYNDEDD